MPIESIATSPLVIDALAIGTLTMLLTQLIKKSLPGNGYGPALVVAVSLFALIVWLLSQSSTPTRLDAFNILYRWAEIAISAIGQYTLITMNTDGKGISGILDKRDRDDRRDIWLPGENNV
jgi:hypothetical protein